VPSSQPIKNLRNRDHLDLSYQSQDWTGPYAAHLATPGGGSGQYPEVVYWAYNNTQGLHISRSNSRCRWEYQHEGAANEDLEVYVR
jgi:hypothetical protein